MRAWSAAGVAGLLAYGASIAAGVAALARDSSPDQVALVVPATVFVVLAVVLGFRASSTSALDARTRSAWRWIAVSFVLLLIANGLFAVQWGFFPAPPDLLRLGMVPVLVTGLLKMPLRRTGRRHRLTVALDAGTVAVAGGGFLWFLQIGPAVTLPGMTPWRILAGSLYPLGDLLLIFGMAVVLLRGDEAVRRPIRVLVAASVPWLLGDTVLGYQKTHTGAYNVAGWVLLFFVTAQFGLAAAAYVQIREAGRGTHSRVSLGVQRVSRLPYAAVAGVFVLLFTVVVAEHAFFPWGGLVFFAFVLTVLSGARQVFAQNENHRMAISDPLTGLANRARLRATLATALDRAAGTGRTTAVLLTDLNGFKHVNDTLGHAAGDALLIAYGKVLRRSVMGGDLAARLGGDEFAIVLPDAGSVAGAEAVARRILEESASPVLIGDTPVLIRGSIGIALAGPGERDPDALLARADRAMYEAKRSGTASWHVDAATDDRFARTISAASSGP